MPTRRVGIISRDLLSWFFIATYNGTLWVPYGLGALPSPLMHPLRGCIWGQGPKGPPCPHYRATEGGPIKTKNKCAPTRTHGTI